MRKNLILLAAFAIVSAQVRRGDSNPTVVDIAGKAEIFRAGEWNEAKIGQGLQPGDAVRVAGDGAVTVEAFDGKISLNGGRDTVIEYDGTADADIAPWNRSRLARAPGYALIAGGTPVEQFSCPAGDIDIRVQTGTPLLVVTPLVTAAARGTRFTMQVTPDGSSSLQLQEGAVTGYDRTGGVRQIAPGQDMGLTSSAFLGFLGTKGMDIQPGQDWRVLPATVLESVDAATFSKTFAQVYYNPVVGRVVKTEAGVDDVDEAKIAKAAYVGDATLDDVLANPNVDPMAPEWAEDLAANPLTDNENGRLNTVYTPGLGNTANIATGGAAGGGQTPGGLDGFDSSLIAGGLPSNDLIPGFGGGSSTAQVRGGLTFDGTGSEQFGFNVNLGSIGGGYMNGSGSNTSSIAFDFDLYNGSGSYDSGTRNFSVSGFDGYVNGTSSPSGGGSLDGHAPNGLGDFGSQVSGNFLVDDSSNTLTGSLNGIRVN